MQDLGYCPPLLPSYPLGTLLPHIWEQVASGSQEDVPEVSDLKVKGEWSVPWVLSQGRLTCARGELLPKAWQLCHRRVRARGSLPANGELCQGFSEATPSQQSPGLP